MVLRPLASGCSRDGRAQDVWPTIEETQHRPSRDYWLIAQPDHAALSGAMAAAMGPPLIPELLPELVEGIAHHDDGWASFDTPLPEKPLSFLDVLPVQFLQAWTNSIESAQTKSRIAGAIVSRHFWRLGSSRRETKKDSAEDARCLREFLAREETRQKQLVSEHDWKDFEFLTDVLQFCDILSLYLCCGAEEDVDFPQCFRGQRVRLRREDAREPQRAAVCRFAPSPFRHGIDPGVMARRFPGNETRQLPFVLF